jgi:hypothetical protein
MGEDIGFHLAAKFFKQISISFEATEYLCDRYSMYLREEQKALFYHIFRQHFTKETLPHVYHGFIQAVRTLVGVKEESVDSFLYDMMPLFTPFQAKKELERLESSLANRFGLKRLGTIPDLKGPFIASCDLIALMRQHLLNHGTSVLSSIDWELGLAEEARRLQLVYPQPIFFADTNWSDWSFGFVQNYGTGQLELWRLSRTGLKGSPMREWDSVFREQGVWSVLVE